MMKGSGHGGKIPDFSGTDMKFYVKDPKLKGGVATLARRAAYVGTRQPQAALPVVSE